MECSYQPIITDMHSNSDVFDIIGIPILIFTDIVGNNIKSTCKLDIDDRYCDTSIQCYFITYSIHK